MNGMVHGIRELNIGDFFEPFGQFTLIYRDRNPDAVRLLLCSFIDESGHETPTVPHIGDT